ncbi:adhesion G-protein coupled receptor D1-like [Saccostrea cucullata]
MVMKTMFSSSFMVKKSLKEKTISGVRGMSALLPVLGLTWVFGILSIDSSTIVFKYLFAIFNSLQGLFIFLFHVLMNNQVRQAMSRKIRKYESRTLTTRTSKNKLVSKSNSKDLYSEEEFKEVRKYSEGSIIPRIQLPNPVYRGKSTPC